MSRLPEGQPQEMDIFDPAVAQAEWDKIALRGIAEQGGLSSMIIEASNNMRPRSSGNVPQTIAEALDTIEQVLYSTTQPAIEQPVRIAKPEGPIKRIGNFLRRRRANSAGELGAFTLKAATVIDEPSLTISSVAPAPAEAPAEAPAKTAMRPRIVVRNEIRYARNRVANKRDDQVNQVNQVESTQVQSVNDTARYILDDQPTGESYISDLLMPDRTLMSSNHTGDSRYTLTYHVPVDVPENVKLTQSIS